MKLFIVSISIIFICGAVCLGLTLFLSHHAKETLEESSKKIILTNQRPKPLEKHWDQLSKENVRISATTENS